MSLKLGQQLPEFTLNDQHGKPFDSASVRGLKPVVVYFYPKNFTPGCTKEACSFRDAYLDFTDLGATVVGISSDTETSHQKFADRYNLPFTLLADTRKTVRKQFGVKNALLGLIPGRETFVFNRGGALIHKFESMNATPHIKKALKSLKQ